MREECKGLEDGGRETEAFEYLQGIIRVLNDIVQKGDGRGDLVIHLFREVERMEDVWEAGLVYLGGVREECEGKGLLG